MHQRVFVAALALLAACAPGCEASESLIVGPGPCSDTMGGSDVVDHAYVVDGCRWVLLVEATRDARTAPITVEGRVLTAGSFHPVPGATVLVLGQDRGVWADRRGRFTVTGLGPHDRLVVSSIGFLSDTLHVGALPGPRLR